MHEPRRPKRICHKFERIHLHSSLTHLGTIPPPKASKSQYRPSLRRRVWIGLPACYAHKNWIEWSDTMSASWTSTWTPICKHPRLKADGTLLSVTAIFRARRVQLRRPRKSSRSTTHSNIAFTCQRWSQRRCLALLTTMNTPKRQYMDWFQLYLEVDERIYQVSATMLIMSKVW